MISMDVVSDVADTTFDVVAPVADVPPSVDSTTLNHASSLGEFSTNDSANGADQAQLSAESTLAAAPLLPQDSVTDHILGVESVQVPFISSAMVDVASDISEDEFEFEYEEDEFIPRGGGSDPGAYNKKTPAPPKAVGKPPKTQSSATPQDSTKPGQSAKAPQAKSGSKPAPPSASAAHPPSKKS
ncbi:hypothetical protein TRAPUB_4465 [Trametes pubescens]|uniref:Uncharacterized protein n=1 Tax=Trametes pubescens TaxID=154538 RepID=A0A1M2VAL5_TRAPU|nr:hypothetical protein TRAPUB_4465 [Trametes pubescens]